MRLILLCLTLFFSLEYSTILFADPSNNIDKINVTIHSIQNEITEDSHEREKLDELLKQSEISIGALDQDLADLNHKIISQREKLNILSQQQFKYQKNFQKEESELSEELKMLYLFEKNHYLESLLSQTDAHTLNRNMMYFKYLNRSHLDSMNQMKTTLNQIQANRKETTEENKMLSAIIAKKREQQHQLEILQQERSKILSQLENDISYKQQQLSELEKNKDRLESLLMHIDETPHVPVQPPLAFDQMQGHFAWPTQGKIVQSFGQQIEESQITSSGVVIEAPKGKEIYALYPGKIVFADWLKGFGLLTIIDHGNGYMTLYARNNSLYHKVGDFVNKGELIAKVGNSGGYAQNGLYFEIRKNGQPINPALWCKS